MISKIKTIIRGIFGIFENLEKASVSSSGFTIGRSAGGYDVKAYKIGDGKAHILFLGSIHGNEIGTAKLVSKFYIGLQNKKVSLQGLSLHFIPVLNIDGHKKALKHPDYFHGGAIGRMNANGVDLNRNFDTNDWLKSGIWEFGDKKVEVSGGEEPFSEPETMALRDYVAENNITIIFDFHNRAGTVLATTDRLGKKIANIYVKASGYKNISENSYQNTGWSKTYFENKGITYIEIETTKRWGSDWDQNKKALLKAIKIILPND